MKQKIIEITGHSDCPMHVSDDPNACGVICPEWYKTKRGVPGIIYKGKRKGTCSMRRQKNCPAKGGILVRLKK